MGANFALSTAVLLVLAPAIAVGAAPRPLPAPRTPGPPSSCSAGDLRLPRYEAAGTILSGQIRGSAPKILPDLVHRWIDAFGRYHPQVSIDAPPPYEPPLAARSEGLRSFIDGDSDFAFLTRELSPGDRASFLAKRGFLPTVIPVANGSFSRFGMVDAIGIIVHPSNPITGLTLAQLDSLFSSTRYLGGERAATWGDLGLAAWMGNPVHVIGLDRGFPESARAQFLRERVFNRGNQAAEWRPDFAKIVSSDTAVVSSVAADPFAIGFVGLSYLTSEVRALPIAMREGNGFAEPTPRNMASGRYPLGRLIYLLLDSDPGPLLNAFARFILSADGQCIVKDQSSFLPLRAPQARASEELLSDSTS